jgi:hypothetical protein
MDIIDKYRELMAPITKITEDVINDLMTEDEGQALVDNQISNRSREDRYELESIRDDIRRMVYRATKRNLIA